MTVKQTWSVISGAIGTLATLASLWQFVAAPKIRHHREWQERQHHERPILDSLKQVYVPKFRNDTYKMSDDEVRLKIHQDAEERGGK
jgi:hypothetical protein